MIYITKSVQFFPVIMLVGSWAWCMNVEVDHKAAQKKMLQGFITSIHEAGLSLQEKEEILDAAYHVIPSLDLIPEQVRNIYLYDLETSMRHNKGLEAFDITIKLPAAVVRSIKSAFMAFKGQGPDVVFFTLSLPTGATWRDAKQQLEKLSLIPLGSITIFKNNVYMKNADKIVVLPGDRVEFRINSQPEQEGIKHEEVEFQDQFNTLRKFSTDITQAGLTIAQRQAILDRAKKVIPTLNLLPESLCNIHLSALEDYMRGQRGQSLVKIDIALPKDIAEQFRIILQADQGYDVGHIKTYPINLERTATWGDAKLKLSKIFLIPVQHIELVKNDSPMADNSVISVSGSDRIEMRIQEKAKKEECSQSSKSATAGSPGEPEIG